jgi:hypothetical protein
VGILGRRFYGGMPKTAMQTNFDGEINSSTDNPNPASGGEQSPSGGTETTNPGNAAETPTGEDVSGLKKALQSERDRAKALEQQFAALRDSVKNIDPVKYKQLEALQEQAEQQQQREIQIRNTYEAEYNQRLAVEKKRASDWETQYNGLMMRTQAEKAFQAAKGRTGAGEDGTTFFEAFFTNIQPRLKLTEKGQIEVVDLSGVRLFSKKDATKLMTPTEFFTDLITHPVFGTFFERQNPAKGGGMNPNQQATHIGGEGLEHLSPAERLSILRERASTRR